MPGPVSVMICRFPGGYVENPDVTDWLVHTVLQMKSDPRISDVYHWRKSDVPITMTRNAAFEAAKATGANYVLMVDNDMKPDAYAAYNTNRLALDTTAVPFWKSSFDFAYEHREMGRGPCVIAAPYCGPPPHENVYVFHWDNAESEHPIDQDLRLAQFTRRHASEMRGITLVGALPTGLILFDMDGLKNVPGPLTYYEWKDQWQSSKGSTEDVTITRDLSLRGIPQYCNWDAWAGHWKRKCVGRPVPITAKQIAHNFREAILRELGVDQSAGEEFTVVKSNGHPEPEAIFVPPAPPRIGIGVR